MRTEPIVTERVREWFKNHHAVFTEHLSSREKIETLRWAKPDTSNYSINYVIMGSVLMVWGDLESAVYRWSSPISWDFLAKCDLQYFAGKCDASPKGRDYVDYDHDLAIADFNGVIKDRAEQGYEHPGPRLVDDARQALKYGADEWHQWVSSNGYQLFGESWYEWVPDLGKRTAQTCAAHLVGIKMAVAQRPAAVAA